MAKYTTETVYDLVESYLSRRKDLAGVGNSTSSLWLTMCGIFNKHFYQEARKADPVSFQSVTSLSVTGAGNYNIADFESMDGHSCGVFKSNSDGTIKDEQVIKTNRGSSTTGAWTDKANQNIVFTGSPSDTYWVVYFPVVAKPAAGGDLLLDENNDEAVIDYFRRMIDIWDSKLGFVNADDAILRNSMKRLINNLNPDPTVGLETNLSIL